MSAVHVIPLNDLIDHEVEDYEARGCVCGPDVELVPGDGGDGWLVSHHSLDGREQYEPHA